ncbi:STAS domain-containing protein [Tsuneonella sp. HG222]
MTDSPAIVRIEVPFERLDAAASPDMRRLLASARHHGQQRVLLDLSRVQFIDSTGLGVLVSMLKQMAPGGRIAVVGAGGAPTRLFQITGLDKLFILCADSVEAEMSLAG